MIEARRSICRVCPNGCAIVVDVEDGIARNVGGDPENPVYQGYSCVKGRSQPAQLRHPDRLLHSMRRRSDGNFEPVPVEQAMDEIANRLQSIVAESGPRSVAGYLGTYVIASALSGAFHNAFLEAIGTGMRFTSSMIDKPGKPIAKALHGAWMAPQMGYVDPDVALLVGLNPFVAYQGFPLGHPGRWLRKALDGGMQLIVIDPRRSDVANRATIHLQIRPGQDAAVLAAMIHVVLAEDLWDHEFVDEHAHGLDHLSRAVAPFTPSVAAERAGIDADDLVRAARVFAAGRKGYAQAGTGPNMHGRGTLNEYLVLVLDTLCGHWPRAGEPVRNPGTLIAAVAAKAQVRPPWPAYGFGEQLRVRNLADTAAGLPTTVLPEEILTPGDGRVRALLSLSGNPAVAFPDQLLTLDALRSLDLLVQVDPWMSQTARLAHYVIAPKMPLEMVGTSYYNDAHLHIGNGYGTIEPWAMYTPAVASPPGGSDLIEEWELYWELASRMGLDLTLAGRPVDMVNKPTTDELFECLHAAGRVPLDEVKRHAKGAVFSEPAVRIAPKDPGWTGRFQLAANEMMGDLGDVAGEAVEPEGELTADGRRQFLLICRRMTHVFNSSCNIDATNRGRTWNPAFMHPDDMSELGLAVGDVIEISSARATIRGFAEADDTLRPGSISMTHGFGGSPEHDDELTAIGSSTSRLVGVDDRWERYSGQPRMSAVPVTVKALLRRDSAP